MGTRDSAVVLHRHRLTVEQFHAMVAAGVLAPDGRCELIDGEIIDMAPQKSRHASVLSVLMRRLVLAAGDRAQVVCQVPLRLSATSEPEPDLMLLRPCPDAYAAEHPGPADVWLLIEVSDTTVRYDREVKVPLYARHGVAEVWLLDLEAARLRVFRRPQDGEYAEIMTFTADEGTARALPGLAQPASVVVLDLLG